MQKVYVIDGDGKEVELDTDGIDIQVIYNPESVAKEYFEKERKKKVRMRNNKINQILK